jgi:hypothetical protein
MEIHKVESGSIIGHGRRDCECGPKRVAVDQNNGSGRWTVYYIHNN